MMICSFYDLFLFSLYSSIFYIGLVLFSFLNMAFVWNKLDRYRFWHKIVQKSCLQIDALQPMSVLHCVNGSNEQLRDELPASKWLYLRLCSTNTDENVLCTQQADRSVATLVLHDNVCPFGIQVCVPSSCQVPPPSPTHRSTAVSACKPTKQMSPKPHPTTWCRLAFCSRLTRSWLPATWARGGGGDGRQTDRQPVTWSSWFPLRPRHQPPTLP